jgi:hypothetical protein
MPKDIRIVKSKSRLQDDLPKQLEVHRKKSSQEKDILEKFIELEPIFEGNPNKFQVVGTRVKWQKEVIKNVKIDGHWLEFGVRDGDTMAWLLEEKPGQNIHGFDSWEGLPEEWKTGGKDYPAGAMAVPMPVFPDNVKLHKGWFDKTLAPWLSDNQGQVAYLHVDSDLYSSAIYVLDTLNDRLVPGTIIVFDELANFRLSGKLNNWPIHEWRAMFEWMEKHDRVIEPVARSCMYQGAVKIIK